MEFHATPSSLRGPAPLFLGWRDTGILIVKWSYSDFFSDIVASLKGPKEILAEKIM